jgi:opacity protein-like surface antigen
MTRTLALLSLSLLALTGTASASDIDELATVPASDGALALAKGADDDAEAKAHRSNRGGNSSRRVVHSTPGRPGRTVVHTTPRQPGRTVVRHGPAPRGPVSTARVVRPARPTTVVRRGPARPVVVTRPAPVTYRYVRPYHGVVVYGPRPVTHVRYVNGAPGPVAVQTADLPPRAIDRNDTFALGVKGGSLISGSNDGGVYGDAGLGLVGRYRPVESFGLEVGVSHHASGVEAFRAQTQVAGSVELFAFPWTRVSPYVLGGVTLNRQVLADDFGLTAIGDGQVGVHGGVGLELALGHTAALDLEGRYIGWVTDSAVNSAPGAIQATAGLLFHF